MSRALAVINRNPVAATAAMLGFLQRNPQVAQQVGSMVVSAGRKAAGALGFPATSELPQSGLTSANLGGSGRNQRSSRQGGRRNRRRRQNQGSNPNPTMGISRELNYSPRMQFRFIYPVTTVTTTGIWNGRIWPGTRDTAFDFDMGGTSSQYSSMQTIFKWQKLNSFSLEFQPLVAFSTSGWVGAVVYPDPTDGTTSISTAQAYLQRRIHFVGDVKQAHKLHWVPTDEQEREDKECDAATGITGAQRRNFAPCVIFIGVNTNLTSGATLAGHFVFTVDLTFNGLI